MWNFKVWKDHLDLQCLWINGYQNCKLDIRRTRKMKQDIERNRDEKEHKEQTIWTEENNKRNRAKGLSLIILGTVLS